MGVIKRVEDINAWQEAKGLAVEIYRLTARGDWSKDFALRDQIRRAAVSVASNIAEGYARDSTAEFARFLAIARGSANEVKTQLHIAHDLGYLDADAFRNMYSSLDKTCGMISNLMSYLKSRQAPKRPAANRQQPTTRATRNGA